jgi:hypothetical protein
MVNNKKLPPYGKKLKQLLAQGEKPKNCIFLFLGINAWQSAKAFNHTQTVLVLPPEKSPYSFNWPVQECAVLAFDKGGLEPDYIEKTAHALLLAGAISIHVVLFNYKLVVYRRC